MDVLLILSGLVFLVFGGEFLVRGAVGLAARLNISPMVIGLTLVGFGTSTPELVTSVQAAFSGSPGIAVGNVVGSNIANILLILGCAALIQPIAVTPAALGRDGTVLVAVSLLCLFPVFQGLIGRGIGAAFLLGLIAYVGGTIYLERRSRTAAAAVYAGEVEILPPAPGSVLRAAVALLFGLSATILGARLLVDGGISLASRVGLSEAVIGLTIVAVGTSLPELVTSVVAARRGHSDVALGNVIGSNIFNILGILGTTAVLKPVSVPAAIAGFDIWIMLLATALLIVFARTGWRIGRREGAVFAGAYLCYTAFLLLGL